MFWGTLLLFQNVFLPQPKNSTLADDQSSRKLFKSREAEYEKLVNSIEKHNVVGLRADWGIGKSFIVDALIERKSKDYNIVEIDTLMSNFDELQDNLINELDQVLSINRVFSKASRRLKAGLSK